MPSIMKDFFDRAFLPGITFKNNKQGSSEGLLKGKTGRITTTAGDLCLKTYEEAYRSSGLVQLQKGILEYFGVSFIQSDLIWLIYVLIEKKRKECMKRIKELTER